MEECLMSAPTPALVLLNPHAGGGRVATLKASITQWLQARAPGVPCAAVEGIDAARAEIARVPRGSRLVLVGGDGTVHQMLPAVVDSAGELALVPVGSGNDVARAFGVAALDWPDALDLALRGAASPVDIGECWADGRRSLFASSLTAGFDSAVGERAIRGPRALRGLPRYLWATFGELAALRHWPMTVTVDGTTVHDGPALFASVLNTPTYGSGMPVVPHARIDDGRLDLLIAGPFGRLGAALMLPRMLAAGHLSHPMVRSWPFTSLHIRAAAPTPMAGEGEPEGSAREWRIDVRPGALRVVRRPA
jgi:diacylglycerol kinase (ATP)